MVKILHPEEHVEPVLESYMIGHDLTVKKEGSDNEWEPDKGHTEAAVAYLITDLIMYAKLRKYSMGMLAGIVIDTLLEEMPDENDDETHKRRERLRL